MRSTFLLVGLTSLACALAVPALAQMDPGAMTCGEYFALDAGGRTDATNAVMTWIKDANNAAVGGALADALNGMTTEEVQGRIDNACEGKDVSANLIESMK